MAALGGQSAQGGAALNGGGAGGNSSAGQSSSLPARVLLYSYSSIGSVPNLSQQLTILQTQLESWQFSVERSEDPAVFTDVNLKRFAAVAMINTCGEVFGSGNSGLIETQALQRFVQAGGGLLGTHCASVTYTNLPAADPSGYNKLLGGRGGDGYFGGESSCAKVGAHTTNAALPDTFSYTGDTDNTDYLAPDTVVVVKCKWSGNGQKEVAASWYRTEGAGRIFFTTFAKTDADLNNAALRDQHIFPALAWVLKR